MLDALSFASLRAVHQVKAPTARRTCYSIARKCSIPLHAYVRMLSNGVHTILLKHRRHLLCPAANGNRLVYDWTGSESDRQSINIKS